MFLASPVLSSISSQPSSVLFSWWITSSIYGSHSYVKWQYGRVCHGTSARKPQEIAFRVLQRSTDSDHNHNHSALQQLKVDLSYPSLFTKKSTQWCESCDDQVGPFCNKLDGFIITLACRIVNSSHTIMHPPIALDSNTSTVFAHMSAIKQLCCSSLGYQPVLHQRYY